MALTLPVHPTINVFATLQGTSVSKCVSELLAAYLRNPVPLPEPVTKGRSTCVHVRGDVQIALKAEAHRQGMAPQQLARRIVDHTQPPHWGAAIDAATPEDSIIVQRVDVPVRFAGEITSERLCAGLALLAHTPFTVASECPKEDTFFAQARIPLKYANWYRKSVLDNRMITTAALELALAQEQGPRT